MICIDKKIFFQEGDIVKIKKGRKIKHGTTCFIHCLNFDTFRKCKYGPEIYLSYIDDNNVRRVTRSYTDNFEPHVVPCKYKKKVGKKVLMHRAETAVFTVNMLESGHTAVTGQRLLKHLHHLDRFLETMVELGIQIQCRGGF